MKTFFSDIRMVSTNTLKFAPTSAAADYRKQTARNRRRVVRHLAIAQLAEILNSRRIQ